MMKIREKAAIGVLVFILTGLISLSALAGEPQKAPLKLKELIEEALQKNPEVIASRSRSEVLKERPSQAASLDDPMLGFGILNLPTDTFNFRQDDMTQKEISVTQRLPFPGKRSLRSDMAQREAEASVRDLEEARIKISREMKTAYYELCYLNKAIAITEKNRELLKLLTQIAETKYSVGEGIQADILRSQVELSKMVEELIMLNQNKRTVKAKINILLYRPAFAPLGEPEEVAPEKFSANPEDLLQEAASQRPLIQSMKKMVERNEVSLRMAQREYYPDFDLKLAYGQRDDGPNGKRADMVSAMVAFNIPLWFKGKQDRKVVESQKDIQSAKSQLAAMTNEVYFLIGEKIAEIERTERQMELLKTGIIPQATLSLDSAMSAYRVNKVDYTALLDSLMTLFKYELQYYRLLSDHEKSIAELESAVGRVLPKEKRG